MKNKGVTIVLMVWMLNSVAGATEKMLWKDVDDAKSYGEWVLGVATNCKKEHQQLALSRKLAESKIQLEFDKE